MKKTRKNGQGKKCNVIKKIVAYEKTDRNQSPNMMIQIQMKPIH